MNPPLQLKDLTPQELELIKIPTHYKIVWSGSKYGGKLTIAVSLTEANKIFFVLKDIPNEIPLVGEIEIQTQADTPEKVFYCIVTAIDEVYKDTSMQDKQILIESNQARLQ